MVKFYNSDIIQHVLGKFKVKNIIVSGVKDEKLINNIINYGGNATFINTVDVDGLKIINGNPLEIFPDLSNYDAVFIDDDPNWYTIFTELNIIKNTNDNFPLIFVCNNKFPNARRDSYINPNVIPATFRQEYMKELPIYYNNEEIFIFDGYYHACEENTSKNGVLTGIEDFLNENSHVGIMKINFIEGITILYTKLPVNQKRIDAIYREINDIELGELDISSKLIENELLISYINKYNENLSEYELEISNNKEIINNYENKISQDANELSYINSKIDGFESELKLKGAEIKNYESKLLNKDKTINDLQYKLQVRDNRLLENEINLNKSKENFAKKESELHNQISKANNEIDNLEKSLLIKEEEFSNKETELNEKNTILNQKQEELIKKDKELAYLNKQHVNQLSQSEKEKYCISCFKEEISNNHAEIKYLRNNSLSKKVLSPFSYLYLILKSNSSEISINYKLLKALKNSKCFDIGFYLSNNPDIQKSNWCKYFSPELHYVCKGFDEGRIFNKKYFNTNSKKELLNYILVCDK